MSSVRLSVRLSVTFVPRGSGSQRLEILETIKLSTRKISPTPSLFVGQKPSTYSQGNMGKFGETRGGVGKSGVLEHKSGNISETRKDMKKLLWRAYRKSQTFFRTVPSPTTYSLPFPKIGVRNTTPKLQSLLSQKRVKLRTSSFVRTFLVLIGSKARYKFRLLVNTLENFQGTHILGASCGHFSDSVIFLFSYFPFSVLFY